jgi:hypothetical protein
MAVLPRTTREGISALVIGAVLGVAAGVIAPLVIWALIVALLWRRRSWAGRRPSLGVTSRCAPPDGAPPTSGSARRPFVLATLLRSATRSGPKGPGSTRALAAAGVVKKDRSRRS